MNVWEYIDRHWVVGAFEKYCRERYGYPEVGQLVHCDLGDGVIHSIGEISIQQQPLPTGAPLPSLFLAIGDCRVEFKRDGSILVNDRKVGDDRETCELFAEFARCQTQGTVGEVSFDRDKILATLRENARLRERLAGMEETVRSLEKMFVGGSGR